ncbi:hypothetical protein FCV43_19645 [Vibrio genomosp. F6]|uniref:hypothetical protein n=1 Tax=Vibrio genomosp. F6 TaxID=723172 RepID=UPI0010BDE452|nr:hypothetical protein [Vibrio genomosp. F6]TKF14499.1 hypothetical protein FCV43_19645 [Vibrio genomosp. F6]
MTDFYPSSLATTMPSASRVGFPLAHLSKKTLDGYSLWWRKRKDGKVAKAALVLCAIAQNQGIKTNEIRNLADACSNPADSIRDINKKLMNKGLMIIRMDPVGVAPNESCHHWFLIEAPIQQVSVKMSSNDPLYNT